MIHFAGGKDGPLVHFLAHMGKQFGENATIGSEMMCTLVDVNLAKTNLFVMLRTAVLFTNVCIGRCVDGIAKLVTKTDFASLKSTKMQKAIHEVEEFLRKAWEETLASRHDQADCFKIFRLACIRTTLMLFKKEKLGRENQVYSMDEIQNMFEKELEQGSTTTTSPQATTHKNVAPAISLGESQDSMFLARKQLGLQVGSFYTVKDIPNRVWTLESVNDQGATLVFFPLLEPSKRIAMTFQPHEIVNMVKPTKAKPSTLMGDTELASLFPSLEGEEYIKCQVFKALLEAYSADDVDESMILVQKTPKIAIFAKKDMKAKSLKLIPCPEKLANVVSKEPTGKFGVCKFQEKSFYITPPKPLKFPKPEDDDQQLKGTFVPFWSCISENEEGTLEMKEVSFHTSHGEIKVKSLVNPTSIGKHQIMALVPSPKKRDEMDAGLANEQAKKKPKK